MGNHPDDGRAYPGRVPTRRLSVYFEPLYAGLYLF